MPAILAVCSAIIAFWKLWSCTYMPSHSHTPVQLWPHTHMHTYTQCDIYTDSGWIKGVQYVLMWLPLSVWSTSTSSHPDAAVLKTAHRWEPESRFSSTNQASEPDCWFNQLWKNESISIDPHLCGYAHANATSCQGGPNSSYSLWSSIKDFCSTIFQPLWLGLHTQTGLNGWQFLTVCTWFLLLTVQPRRPTRKYAEEVCWVHHILIAQRHQRHDKSVSVNS